MYKIYLQIISSVVLFFLVSFLFFGCSNDFNKTLSSIKINSVITNKVLKQSEVSGDIHLSVSALIMKMRHKNLKSNKVTFDKNGIHLIYENDFKYKGFRWDLLKISKYNVIATRKNITTFNLEGLITFSDKIGRITSSVFSMQYEIKSKKNIKILNSEIFDYYLSSPNVQTYFVPLSKLEKNSHNLKNFKKLYTFAKKNAIRVRANKDELNQYNKLSFMDKAKGNLPNKSIKGEFCAVVFCMERFPSKSIMSIGLGDNTGNIYADADIDITPLYKNYNGWLVSIIGFDGKIRENNNPFTINVFYQKNNNAHKKLIGKFNNSMDYNEYNLKKEILSSGEVLLNINIKNNAKLIQARLFELGYYKGIIDGDFGKNSKKALNNFARDKMENYKGEWSLEIQKILFLNVGL